MKVVIAAMSAPTRMNGVSRHGANLARALLSSSAISEVHFIAGEWQRAMFGPCLPLHDARLHPHWIRLREANVSRLVWYRRELPCIAAQLEADIVHLTFPAPMARAAYSCPVVLSLHDLYPFDIPRNFGLLKSAIARFTIAQCVRRVNAIACVSTSTQRILKERFHSLVRKTVVIPNVVEFQSPTAPAGVEPLKGRTFVLCVAQHRSNKNIPLTVRVFEKLLQARALPPDARLAIVGIFGPETENICETIRSARLTSKVLLLSGLTDAEMRWCFEQCEVLLAPSTNEGFGLPIVEGLLAGARVVCSDIPAFREIAGNACRYVPWTDDPADAYARAVEEELKRPRRAGLHLARFAATSIGRHFAELYAELGSSPRSDFKAPSRGQVSAPLPVSGTAQGEG